VIVLRVEREVNSVGVKGEKFQGRELGCIYQRTTVRDSGLLITFQGILKDAVFGRAVPPRPCPNQPVGANVENWS